MKYNVAGSDRLNMNNTVNHVITPLPATSYRFISVRNVLWTLRLLMTYVYITRYYLNYSETDSILIFWSFRNFSTGHLARRIRSFMGFDIVDLTSKLR